MADGGDLVGDVHHALLELRGTRGTLTPQKLAQFPVLVNVLGGDDLLDAFMAFQRELRRIVATANRDEAAAALSIYAKAETVIDRLEYTAVRLSDKRIRDQRTARRWSDDGMPHVAADLVYMAKVHRRLGREMLSIELRPGASSGLMVIVDQIVQADLDASAPKLSLWAMDADGDPRELSLDLARVQAAETTNESRVMRRQRVVLEQELLARVTPTAGLTLAIVGRDAPMRTASFESHWQTPGELTVRFSAYRARAAVELSRES